MAAFCGYEVAHVVVGEFIARLSHGAGLPRTTDRLPAVCQVHIRIYDPLAREFPYKGRWFSTALDRNLKR
jgi:hypothetical protein